MKKKLAIVVQRYGTEFAGGSEYLARWLATRLNRFYSITVLTTTAQDAVTWANHYPSGESELEGVHVVRFPVLQTRQYSTFAELSDRLFSGEHRLEEEFEWLEQQGPLCPGIISHIDDHTEEYDLFIFITYLYYPVYFGLHHAKTKSIFIPTAHNEPPLHLTIYRHIFRLPAGIIFLAEEEKDFILDNFQPITCPWTVAGIGIETSTGESEIQSASRADIPGLQTPDYIYSCGRIEAAKGYEQLCSYFLRYVEDSKSKLSLVLSGNTNMTIPESSRIIYLGFVSDEQKIRLIRHSRGVVIPSSLESLSLLALESWSHGKTVIVNGQSGVLRGHVLRCKGGLIYETYEQFENCFRELESEPEKLSLYGRQGRNYVINNYSEKAVLNNYRNFINSILFQDNDDQT